MGREGLHDVILFYFAPPTSQFIYKHTDGWCIKVKMYNESHNMCTLHMPIIL